MSLTGGRIASMTGYGRAEARGALWAVTVEMRSVNHRFLDVAVKLGRGLGAHEAELRRIVQGRLARGRADVAVTARRITGSQGTVHTDVPLGAGYLAGARALADALGLPDGLTVAELMRLPGVVSVEDADEDAGETRLLVKEAAEQALAEVVRMRQAEGAALAAELRAHVDALEAWAAGLDALLPVALARIRERFGGRIRELLGETPADPGRLAQEVATWAARSDVAEELARLRSHCAQFRALLTGGGPVGRQLDFLAQEMHREVNTVGAKADDAEMIARLLEGRTLVARLREQVQNLE